jgi:hypothetical protein
MKRLSYTFVIISDGKILESGADGRMSQGPGRVLAYTPQPSSGNELPPRLVP